MVDLRRARSLNSDQQGFTLVELLVSMLVFAIFLTILISSIVGITRASTRVSVIAQTSNGILSVFQSMDRQIRYADSINFPATVANGNVYVEFRTPASSAPNGVTTCTQYRYVPSTLSLQLRQWPDVAGTPAPAWINGLTNVANDGGSTYPFKMIPASSGGSLMQQLTLSIDGGAAPLKGAAIATTFVARNSSVASPSNAQSLLAGTSDTPVCIADLGSAARL